jgi:hypothetical protein
MLSQLLFAAARPGQDLMRIDSERAREIQITLVEGFQLLGSFDVRLREYAARKLHKQGVHLIKARRMPSPKQAHWGLCHAAWLVLHPRMQQTDDLYWLNI